FYLFYNALHRLERYVLPTPRSSDLISDADETLCRLFDVIRQKQLYGKQYEGIERSTFLIDREGVLRREWRKVKVPGHVAEVLAAARRWTEPASRQHAGRGGARTLQRCEHHLPPSLRPCATRNGTPLPFPRPVTTRVRPARQSGRCPAANRHR